MITIKAVGGYGEVGRNMTAVKVDDEIVIFDMGLHMPNYVRFTEEEREEVIRISEKELRKANAIPDDSMIENWKDSVVAIVPSHAHLDHLGAIPFMAQKYKAPIICTPYTAAVLNATLKADRIKLPNRIIELRQGKLFRLSGKLTLEFIDITHSIPDSALIALHTKYGSVLYTLDFKFDNTPVIGKKPNYKRLNHLRKKCVKVVIVDSLYAYKLKKTHSEAIAREMLKEVLLNVDNKKNAILVTTFSSHIARLKSIVEFGRKLKRKVVFLGRSLEKYCLAAEDCGIYYFSKKVDIVKYGKRIESKLKSIEREGREKFLLVVTGHQGEPKATLSKISRKEIPFRLKKGDTVIFSCQVIPTNINKMQREQLEKQLKSFGVRIFKDIHVSGHGSRKDMRELINFIKPEHIIPAHSSKEVINDFIKLGQELGYEPGKNLHALTNGLKVVL